jgi:rhodanese-related sulfurtransferase
MDDMLNIEAIVTLDPMSTFAPALVNELLDFCRMEYVPDGQNPFSKPGMAGQALYLVEGQLELAFADKNRLKIAAGTEWARQPLGRKQPDIASATALGDIRLLCINNDLLEIMVTRGQRLSQEIAGRFSKQEVADSCMLSSEHFFDSGMNSLGHFKLWPFMQLSPERLGKLLQMVEVVVAWDNETVIREGEAGDYYYLIEKGRAEVSRRVGGSDMVLAELVPGDAFGEEALISGAKRNATITMKSNGLLLRLKQNDFLELMQEPLLHYMDYQTAMAKVAEGATWLDVRHPPEYHHGKLPKAINVPLNDIRHAIGVLDIGKQYIVYCQNGRRSSVAAFILARAGYDVSVLDGGLQASPRLDDNSPVKPAA